MKRNLSRTIIFMIILVSILITLTIVFLILYLNSYKNPFLFLYVTFLTISYHFLMRLLVGEIVSYLNKRRKFNYNSYLFKQFIFEKTLYRFLKVNLWKDKVITAIPTLFIVNKTNYDELLKNMANAEIVHLIIMVLSYLPLLLIIPYGLPLVFILTSFFSSLFDSIFVIVQRYNIPRVMKIKNRMNDKIYRKK